nr:reverse transcriptase domain-containing protein [Tanacetum cinerariifolium]
MMTTVNQGMSIEEIKRVVAQRVANAIKAIAIYEAKTNSARKSMSQTERQKEKVEENASNKRKWEGNHNESSSQQNKGHKVPRAHTALPINKKAYAGSLPLCNQCKFHHNGPCTETMTTVNQGISVKEIERVVAQRVPNAIEAIAIYETRTNLARKSMSRTKRQEEEVAENASNKRKWESNHNGSLSQQNKGHKVPRAHTAWPINKKAHAGSLPLYN